MRPRDKRSQIPYTVVSVIARRRTSGQMFEKRFFSAVYGGLLACRSGRGDGTVMCLSPAGSGKRMLTLQSPDLPIHLTGFSHGCRSHA